MENQSLSQDIPRSATEHTSIKDYPQNLDQSVWETSQRMGWTGLDIASMSRSPFPATPGSASGTNDFQGTPQSSQPSAYYTPVDSGAQYPLQHQPTKPLQITDSSPLSWLEDLGLGSFGPQSTQVEPVVQASKIGQGAELIPPLPQEPHVLDQNRQESPEIDPGPTPSPAEMEAMYPQVVGPGKAISILADQLKLAEKFSPNMVKHLARVLVQSLTPSVAESLRREIVKVKQETQFPTAEASRPASPAKGPAAKDFSPLDRGTDTRSMPDSGVDFLSAHMDPGVQNDTRSLAIDIHNGFTDMREVAHNTGRLGRDGVGTQFPAAEDGKPPAYQ